MAGSDIYRGTLTLLILQTLTMGARHGYGIGALIREQSGGLLDPGEGVLYPALRRMEKKGLVVVQDQETSVVWGMPGAIAHAGLADHILPVPRIAALLDEQARVRR